MRSKLKIIFDGVQENLDDVRSDFCNLRPRHLWKESKICLKILSHRWLRLELWSRPLPSSGLLECQGPQISKAQLYVAESVIATNKDEQKLVPDRLQACLETHSSKFKYVGTILRNMNRIRYEIKRRLNHGNCYHVFRKLSRRILPKRRSGIQNNNFTVCLK